jgi:hypothetical protein
MQFLKFCSWASQAQKELKQTKSTDGMKAGIGKNGFWNPLWFNRRGYWVILYLHVALAGVATCYAGGVVTNCTEADLRGALVVGGLVTFECDGALALSSSLVISNDTTIDATGHAIMLTTGAVIQPFGLVQVNPGVTLALNHLTLANGFARGTNSAIGNGTGGGGIGGAVWNNGGTLQASDCVFSNNMALGGTGGPGVSGTIAFNFGGLGYGGAIFNDAGVLTLSNVLFIGNTAKGGQGGSAPSPPPSEGGPGGPSAGGALYSRTGLVTIAGCRFVNNSAPASVPGPANGHNPDSGPAAAGATYFVSGTNVISNTVFEHQYVGGGQWFCDASAGALYQTAGALRLIGCTFATNQVIGGDGIIIGSGSNAGSADGGALLLNYMSAGPQGLIHLYCDAVISNCCFIRNLAKGGLQGPAVGAAGTAYGGAIESSTTLRIFNCTLAANFAAGGDITYPSYPLSSAYGGALYLGGTSTLTHVTIAGNSVTKGAGAAGSSVALGGGVYVSGGRIYVRNSIFSTNIPANCAGALQDDGRSISSDSTCAFSAPGSLNNTDPKLAAIGAYGGLTLTMALRPGSPALDAGNVAFCLAADQRGVPRPQGAKCDMGAFEGVVLSVSRDAAGNWLLNQGAVPGATCTLQSSLDLMSWGNLQTTNADQNGQAAFLVPDSGSAAVYFRSFCVP